MDLDTDAIAELEMKIDRVDATRKTALHNESINGNAEVVRFILRHFAHKNLLVKLDNNSKTALLWAAYYGHTEVVEILMDAARHLPPSDDDNPVTSFQAFLRHGDGGLNTALHLAVEYGHTSIVKLLVEADPTHTYFQNGVGKTPMYLAVEEGYNHIVEIICTTCTAPSLDGPGGSTALHAATRNLRKVKEEDRDMIKMIIDAAKRQSNSEDAPHESLGAFFNRTDQSTRTVLEVAMEQNQVDVVELILQEDPAYHHGCRGSNRSGGLMHLIYNAIDLGYSKDIVKLLSQTYEAGITTGHTGVVSLILAIRTGDKEKVFYLLDKYAKDLVTFADNLGWTALHYAVYHEFDSIIGTIVEAQKSFGHEFVYRDMVSTPFHVAAEKGYTFIMILLMELWPSWSSAYTAIDKNGQNILHLAALQSKKEMIQGILKNCPEEYKNKLVNEQDNNGDTPLHLLSRSGCFVPELLRYQGLDIRVENNKKWTAHDMLYFEDHVIDDQVQIKIALDGIQTDQTRHSLSSVPLSKRGKKDVKFSEEAKQMMQEKNAQIKKDPHSLTSCYADAIAGDPISKAALEMEADTVLDKEGRTILHIESMIGDTARVGFIVREFANKKLLVKLDGSKQTALHLAAQFGHTQVVEALIDAARHFPSFPVNDDTHNTVSSLQDFTRQANVPDRNTALHLAVLNSNLAIVKLLVEANPNDSHVQNSEGKTPIYIAAENGYKDIVEEICTTCTALSLDGPGGRTTALHTLIQNISQVSQGASDVIRMMVDAAKSWISADFEALFCRTDELGRTVLQLAVERNYVDAVKLILLEDPAYQHGREIKRNGLMRLIYKAINDKYSDDIIKSLSETYNTGIDPDHKDVLDLILAIKNRDEDSVLRLLRVTKELATFKEDNGWTPLHYAVFHEFDSILGAMIEAQEEVGHQFEYRNMESTPFHVAVEHGYTSTLLLLMQLWPALSSASTAVNSPYTILNKDHQNLLHLAAAANRKEMVQGILKYCPEKYKDQILKQQDTSGNTPLHLIISRGCFIPELIKHKGLDTMVKNKANFTPRDMLYDQNDVVADQVRIKIVLDAVQTNHSGWNLWAKSKEKKMDIWKSTVVTPSKQRIKDVIFDEKKKLVMDAKYEKKKKELERYKMRTNTQIIVTALITTVTFTVGFTMPGGLYQSGDVDEGLVVLSKKTAFNVFMVSDALALLLSTSSLFFYFLESMNEDPRQVAKLNAASAVLNIVSVIAMMLTFIAGTYVVLSHSPALAITICFIGSLFFLLIVVLSIKTVYDRKVKRNED